MTRTIVLADDEELIADVYRFTLEEAGFRVVLARDGKEALRKVKAESPDVVLLDLLMPGMNGFEVLESLRRATFDKPIIVISNLGQDADKERCLALGAADYAVKADMSTDDLLAIVRRHLP